jgi:formate/nitrite transporter FocA (FNT family)
VHVELCYEILTIELTAHQGFNILSNLRKRVKKLVYTLVYSWGGSVIIMHGSALINRIYTWRTIVSEISFDSGLKNR